MHRTEAQGSVIRRNQLSAGGAGSIGLSPAGRPALRSAGRVLLALLLVVLAAPPGVAADFSGQAALDLTGKVVAFGPRYPGSEAHDQLQAFLKDQLKGLKCQVEEDHFTANTPRGPVEMTNIIARFLGSSERTVVFTGHYDTKYLPQIRFVGANDGGSSTGLLLEMARVLSERDNRLTVYLVWFDGEEAFGEWSSTDGIYGSRHLARKWHDDGTASKIVGLVNVDMTGDADLTIMREQYSTRSLQNVIWESAAALGYEKHFLDGGIPVEDDHVPFLRVGVTAVDLIDFALGPYNRYWHTADDTMDKLGADSFEVVGKVLLGTLDRLEQRQ